MKANPGITHSSLCKDIVFTRAWHNINAVRREQRRRKEKEGRRRIPGPILGFVKRSVLLLPKFILPGLAIVGMGVV
jgi:hypothetical protein